MDKQMKRHQSAFLQEARELLAELESALLELEEIPDSEDLIGRVFRAMHTIKGSGAMFGFQAIADFTHELETVYDRVRSGRMAVGKELIDLSLSSLDLISEMLSVSENGGTADPQRTGEIISGLKSLMPAPAAAGTGLPGIADTSLRHASSEEPAAAAVYRIRFHPSSGIFATGTNPLLLLEELAQLGECHVVAHTDGIPLLPAMAPEACHVFWDIILTTGKGEEAIRDVFIFVEDTCEVSVQVIDEDDGSDTLPAHKKLGEILVERGDLPPEEVARILKGQKRIGELLTDAGVLSPGMVESALMEQAQIRKLHAKRAAEAGGESIRVDAEKLDGLVDLVGELVTVQARLNDYAALDPDGELMRIAEQVDRLVGELRDNTMSIRMRPIGALFSKFKRLVRDLSDSLGKEVVLTTEGGETELDKTVLEQLKDPFVHIIRNCIDHGIESPEKRREISKPPHGTVHLSAAHIGANVVVRITDDGAGLDADAIRETAVAKGILSPDAALSEKEIFDLIFTPGFSTARTITGVSGRGVGMDVVKKSIETLRGSLEVTSQRGAGTTFALVLPLTLAIIEGFMVSIGSEQFIFPLAAVVECEKIPEREMESVRRRNMLNIRGEVVPYRSLREVFGINGTSPSTERIVVIDSGGQRIGFGVDGIIGQHQTVIKPLGKMCRNTRGISGASILGDGSVALIMDVAQLIDEMG